METPSPGTKDTRIVDPTPEYEAVFVQAGSTYSYPLLEQMTRVKIYDSLKYSAIRNIPRNKEVHGDTAVQKVVLLTQAAAADDLGWRGQVGVDVIFTSFHGLPGEVRNLLYLAVRKREEEQGWLYDYHIYLDPTVEMDTSEFASFLDFLEKERPAVGAPRASNMKLAQQGTQPYRTAHLSPWVVAYEASVIDKLWPLDIDYDLPCRQASFVMQNTKAAMLYRERMLLAPAVQYHLLHPFEDTLPSGCNISLCLGTARVLRDLPLEMAPCVRPHPAVQDCRDVEVAIAAALLEREKVVLSDDECSVKGSVGCRSDGSGECSPPKWGGRTWTPNKVARAGSLCLVSVGGGEETERASGLTAGYAAKHSYRHETMSYPEWLLKGRTSRWGSLAMALDVMSAAPGCSHVAVLTGGHIEVDAPPLPTYADTIVASKEVAGSVPQLFVVSNTALGAQLLRTWVSSGEGKVTRLKKIDFPVLANSPQRDVLWWERLKPAIPPVDTASLRITFERPLAASRWVPPKLVLHKPDRVHSIGKVPKTTCSSSLDLTLVLVTSHLGEAEYRRVEGTLENLAGFDWGNVTAEVLVVVWHPDNYAHQIDNFITVPKSRTVPIRFVEVPVEYRRKVGDTLTFPEEERKKWRKPWELKRAMKPNWVYEARNAGIMRAKGRWVLSMATGDVLPTALLSAVALKAKSPGEVGSPFFVTGVDRSLIKGHDVCSSAPFRVDEMKGILEADFLMGSCKAFRGFKGYAEGVNQTNAGAELLCHVSAGGVVQRFIGKGCNVVSQRQGMIDITRSPCHNMTRHDRNICWGVCDALLDDIVYNLDAGRTSPPLRGFLHMEPGTESDAAEFQRKDGESLGLVVRAWLHDSNHDNTAKKGISMYRILRGSPFVLDNTQFDVIVITPTYRTWKQTHRLCFEGAHLARDGRVLWIISDDSNEPNYAALDMLDELKVRYVYLFGDKRGFFGHVQRRLAMEFIKKNRIRGTVTMSDDDNYYSPRFYQALRHRLEDRLGYITVGISTGNRANIQYLEGPRFSPSGEYINWKGGWLLRKYPIDMGSFSYDAKLLWKREYPLYTHTGEGGESEFLESLLGSRHSFHHKGGIHLPSVFQCLPDQQCNWFTPLMVHNFEHSKPYLEHGPPICRELRNQAFQVHTRRRKLKKSSQPSYD